jgi:SAM-dependent methyltransferase
LERLHVEDSFPYNATEFAIHLGRYLPLRTLVAGKRVLDAACGQGYAAHLMKSWGAAEVVGVDVSEEAVRSARHRFAAPKLSFHQSDLAAFLANRRSAFDMIVCVETLEHLSDPTAALKAFSVSKKKSGMIYLTCPNDSWYFGKGRSLNPHHLSTFTFSHFKDWSEKHLGPAKGWFLGGLATGFVTWPVDLLGTAANWSAALRDLKYWQPTVAVLPGQDGPPEAVFGARDALYFAGFWANEELPTGTAALVPAPSTFRIPQLSLLPSSETENDSTHVFLCGSELFQAVTDLRSAIGDRIKVEVTRVDEPSIIEVLSEVFLRTKPTHVHVFGQGLAEAIITDAAMWVEMQKRSRISTDMFVQRMTAPILTCSMHAADMNKCFSQMHAPLFDGCGIVSLDTRDQPKKSYERNFADVGMPSEPGDTPDLDIIRKWLRLFRESEVRAKAGLRAARAAVIRSRLKEHS